MPKYWFKRRRYGWGWMPVTWQGVLTIVLYLFVVTAGVVMVQDVPGNKFTKEIALYLLFVTIATLTLVSLAIKKGPKPKWRWGKSTNDNPEEDF